VSCSSAFKSLLSVVVLLSIAWKIAITSDRQRGLNDGLVEFLTRNHFDVFVADQSGVPLIQAKTASCSLQIARLAPDGSNRDLIRDLAGSTDRFFVVFRGQTYAQQPILWTVLSDIWSRHLREFGIVRHITPVFAVAANSSCDAERLPWNELREAF
jgi:hypothetical protein